MKNILTEFRKQRREVITNKYWLSIPWKLTDSQRYYIALTESYYL